MQEGTHSFDGKCDPAKCGGAWSGQETFSVGIFQWAKKSSGAGLKRGPVKVRIVGLVSDPESVYAKANEIAGKLDAGVYAGSKTVSAIAS